MDGLNLDDRLLNQTDRYNSRQRDISTYNSFTHTCYIRVCTLNLLR